MKGDYGITMALGYAWFDSYDSVGYVVTLHISPFADCPYLPIAKSAFFGAGQPLRQLRQRWHLPFEQFHRPSGQTIQ